VITGYVLVERRLHYEAWYPANNCKYSVPSIQFLIIFQVGANEWMDGWMGHGYGHEQWTWTRIWIETWIWIWIRTWSPPILRPLLLSACSLAVSLGLSFRPCRGSGVATDCERAQTDCVFALLSSSESPCSSHLHLHVFGAILSIFFVCNICTYVCVFLFWRLVFLLLLRVDTFFRGDSLISLLRSNWCFFS
jgi:hypothetical protein